MRPRPRVQKTQRDLHPVCELVVRKQLSLMADNGENKTHPHRRSWMRWLLIGLGIVFLLLVVFHGPILRTIVHRVATNYAAGQNLKLDFRIAGDPIDKLDLQNVHATATGPCSLQSLEADRMIVDYSIPDLVFHGMSDALKNVELHNATALIDSSKALPTPTPAQTQKVSLPGFFPDRLEATNVNVTMRGQQEDTVVKDLDIGLYPDREGKLSIAKLQVPGVNTWTDLSGITTYQNKNLYIHNLKLDENNKLDTVNVDASRIGEGKLGLELKGTIGGGDIASKMELSPQGNSYNAKTEVHAKNISLGQLSGLLGGSADKGQPAQKTQQPENGQPAGNGQ
jgi:hypothetical protein